VWYNDWGLVTNTSREVKTDNRVRPGRSPNDEEEKQRAKDQSDDHGQDFADCCDSLDGIAQLIH